MLEDEWFAAVHAALPDLPKSDDDVLGQPVVSLFGVYDAGKSTLLKRLLVEAGVPIPSWLTVSARRETFELNDVEAFGCVLRDTPGIAAGSAAHEDSARDAVLQSDVMLLVMPPQLVTGDKLTLLPLLSGTAFRKEGLPCPRSLLAVIAKLDERADPVDDLPGYCAYAERKQAEWQSFIATNRLPLERAPVFAVSADPMSHVGNDPTPKTHSYLEGCREWDGIAALIMALEDLPRQMPALRQASRLRRLCSRLTENVTLIDEDLLRNGQVQAEAEQQRKRVEDFADRRDLLEEVAQAELRRQIEEEISSFFATRSKDVAVLRGRLENRIGDWMQEQTGLLARLIDEVGTSPASPQAERWQAAEWKEPSAAAAPDRSKSTRPAKGPTIVDKLLEIRRHWRFGDTTTKDLLKKKSDLEKIKDAAESANKLKNVDEQLASSVRHDKFAKIAPAAIEVMSIFMEWVGSQVQAEASAVERAERQQRIEAYGAEMSADAWHHISREFHLFRDWLGEQRAALGELTVISEAERERLREKKSVSEALLSKAPLNQMDCAADAV